MHIAHGILLFWIPHTFIRFAHLAIEVDSVDSQVRVLHPMINEENTSSAFPHSRESPPKFLAHVIPLPEGLTPNAGRGKLANRTPNEHGTL